jgi:hypothetical protein
MPKAIMPNPKQLDGRPPYIRVLKATGYPHAIMELVDKKTDWSLSAAELTVMAGSLLMHLWNHEHAWVFDTPVDPPSNLAYQTISTSSRSPWTLAPS